MAQLPSSEASEEKLIEFDPPFFEKMKEGYFRKASDGVAPENEREDKSWGPPDDEKDSYPALKDELDT